MKRFPVISSFVVLIAAAIGCNDDTGNPTVGSGGGYGGIYCFALTP